MLRWQNQYVVVAGEFASAAVEHDADERKVDHVWIEIRAGEYGRLQIALSTCSRQSRAAGFDPRVRLAIVQSRWSELPAAGIKAASSFDYATVDRESDVDYVAHERPALEQMLIEKARRAFFIEAWGEFYVRTHAGIHQVHSRRASLAVTQDVVGKDGALRVYFREPNVSELLLFKFTGQP